MKSPNARIAPKQSRGHKAERKIIQAAQKVFSQKGYSGATVAEIISTAGTSTGNFYYRFKNKEALFHYMLEQFAHDIHTAFSSIHIAASSIDALLYRMIEKNTQLLGQNRGFYRAITEISIRNPEIWDKLKALTEQTADAVIIHAKPFLGSIKAPNPENALRQAIRLITGSLANQAVHYPDQLVLDEPENILRLYRAAIGILNHYPPPKLEG